MRERGVRGGGTPTEKKTTMVMQALPVELLYFGNER